MPDKGDIYSIKVFYQGTTGPYKTRPVLIINNTPDKKYTIIELTSVSPKDPPGYYDRFKEKVEKWDKYGLDKQSYVKCKNIHNVEDVDFLEYIGTMDLDEFERIIDKIVKVI